MGRAIFLCGGSASGKTTIYRLAGVGKVCCKATTRKLRKDETEGIDFFVKTEDEFSYLEKQGAFIDVSGRYGKRYGILRDWFVKNTLNSDIVLYSHTYDSMSQSKKNIINEGYKALTIAVLSHESDIKNRLFIRHINEPKRRTRSIEEAINENRNIVKYLQMYDSHIINRHLEEAVVTFQTIVAESV